MTLPEFSVRQTVFVNVLFFVCMIGGWNALKLTEVEYFHDVVLNQVVVTTTWTGASADEVERLVTAKLEDELITIGDIEEMRSASQSNISMISLDVDENLETVDYESAVNDIRGAIEQAEALPLDAEEPSLREIISEEVSDVVFIVVSDTGGVGDLALRDVAQEVESRVREIPGVSKVDIRGSASCASSTSRRRSGTSTRAPRETAMPITIPVSSAATGTPIPRDGDDTAGFDCAVGGVAGSACCC